MISLNSVSLMSSVGLKGCVCVEVDPLALKEQMRKGVLNIWGEGGGADWAGGGVGGSRMVGLGADKYGWEHELDEGKKSLIDV